METYSYKYISISEVISLSYRIFMNNVNQDQTYKCNSCTKLKLFEVKRVSLHKINFTLSVCRILEYVNLPGVNVIKLFSFITNDKAQ
jgi:negative regulator of genetic competence, sporulation and motility